MYIEHNAVVNDDDVLEIATNFSISLKFDAQYDDSYNFGEY